MKLFNNIYIKFKLFFKNLTGSYTETNDSKILRLWKLADEFEVANNKKSANIIYEKLIKVKPKSLAQYIYVALAFQRLQNYSKALKLCEEAIIKNELNIFPVYCQITLISGEIDRYIKFTTECNKFEMHKNFAINKLSFTLMEGDFFQFFLFNYKKILLKNKYYASLLLRESIKYLPTKQLKFKQITQILENLKYMDLDVIISNKIYSVIKKSNCYIELHEDEKYSIDCIYTCSMPGSFSSISSALNHPKKFVSSIKKILSKNQIFSLHVDHLSFIFSVWVPLFCSAQANNNFSKSINFFEKFCFKSWPQLNYTAPHAQFIRTFKQKNKIRIGFNYLDSMPMISGILSRLDKNIFDTVFLYPKLQTDGTQAKLWHERANFSIPYSATNVFSAIQTIADQKLDIIISGPCNNQIFIPMLARLAPLQMILLEPNWMDGTKNLDYYISWKKAEPKNPNNLYKSKVAFLEHPPYWIERPLTFDQVYSRLELNQFRRKLLNIKTQQRIYLCANTPPKIHPKMDDAFKAILDKDKLAVLVFLRSDYVAVDIIKNRLSLKLGSNYKRVVFLPTLSQKDAHLLVQVADCCLDSFPICGMSSSFDASILGVPIVTFPHKNSFGSWTAAIYKHIGIEGLIAKNTKEYVNISLKLASNKVWRNKISNEIKNRSSVLIENKSAVDEFQSFIIKAWERRCNGLSPQNFGLINK